VAFANSGRENRHVDPGETGCFDTEFLTLSVCPTH
jgi:hypothetical protein